ncbi:MAG: hypothetical protein ACN4GM_12055 [Gammaproteobacteria bacterium]
MTYKTPILFFLLMALIPGLQAAQEFQYTDSNFQIGIGFSMVRFNSNVKYTDNTNDRSLFVDAEGTLGLEKWDSLPVLYGTYKINNKNLVGFSYFQVKRSTSLFNFEDDIGDAVVKGDITFSDETQFFNIYYGHTLFQDDRSFVLMKFGINSLDLKYALEATGEISYRDLSISSEHREETGVFAPLPLFGLKLMHRFDQNWSVSTDVSWIAGNYEDTRGWIVQTNVIALYRFNKNFGGLIGVTYFDADITINDQFDTTEVQYSYDGLFLGLHMVF